MTDTPCHISDKVPRKAILYSRTFSIMHFTPGLYIVLSAGRSRRKVVNYQWQRLYISRVQSEIYRCPE